MRLAEYDLCFAWNWEYDAGFARLLQECCFGLGLSMLQVTPETVQQAIQDTAAGKVSFSAYFDRASDVDEGFHPLADLARDAAILRINPLENARRAWDKATMHLELLTAGFHLPYSIILPPFTEQPGIPHADLSLLGGSYSCKPALGSGGDGVITRVDSWEQVLEARRERPAENYLLQSFIVPKTIADRPAWFRVIYCAGSIYPCWWHPDTHSYLPVTFAEQVAHGLFPLKEILARIADVCRLHLFSSEIALTQEGKFIVVDYVNDPIDLRLQSSVFDGVPDVIVRNVVLGITKLLGKESGHGPGWFC